MNPEAGDSGADDLKKRNMSETMYRASRVLRVLASPTAYLIVRALIGAKLTPSELSATLGVPAATVSGTLRHLREVDIVSYEAAGKHKTYWLKDGSVGAILELVEAWVDRMRRRARLFDGADGAEGA